MSATIHRWLTFLSGVLAGTGGIWSATDAQVLGIPPEVGALCALAAGLLAIVATGIRANFAAP